MNKRFVGIGLLAVGSLVMGIMAGNYAFRLFDKTVPPAVITDLVRGGAHAAYVSFGVVLGVVVFLWSMAVAFLARFFRVDDVPAPKPPSA